MASNESVRRKPGQRGPGRHKVTEKFQQQVEALAGYGIPQRDIGHVIGTDVETLTRYYRLELDLGKAKANAAVGRTLFQKALSGDTACLIFWTKSQMGWSERPSDGENSCPRCRRSVGSAASVADAMRAAATELDRLDAEAKKDQSE